MTTKNTNSRTAETIDDVLHILISSGMPKADRDDNGRLTPPADNFWVAEDCPCCDGGVLTIFRSDTQMTLAFDQETREISNVSVYENHCGEKQMALRFWPGYSNACDLWTRVEEHWNQWLLEADNA